MYYYDLYISVGGACRPAYHLQANDLRNEAYPLDWQMEYSLDTVIHLFKTQFVDFFVDIEEDNNRGDSKYRWINDTTNNIVSIHYFSRNIEVEKAQKKFLEKMSKRFKNMDDKLEKAKRVVLICNRTDTIEKLQLFLKEFSLLYPHLEIKLINIRNNEEMEINSYNMKRYVLSDCLSIEEYSFNDTFNGFTQERADWRGNMEIWGNILNNYYNKHRFECFRIMQKIKDENKELVIYGAGKRCLDLLYRFDKYDIQIKGIAVTDTHNNSQSIRQYGVNAIEKYDKDDTIVISLKDRYEAEIIKNTLLSKGYYNLYFVNDKLNLEKAF